MPRSNLFSSDTADIIVIMQPGVAGALKTELVAHCDWMNVNDSKGAELHNDIYQKNFTLIVKPRLWLRYLIC